MPTFNYEGASLADLILDLGSGFDAFNSNNIVVVGTGGANTFDLTGITAYVNSATFSLLEGNDTFLGSNLAEFVYGGDGDDTLSGNGGNDILIGDAGNDVLNGGAGDDMLFGGGGNNTYSGGTGSDTVYFNGEEVSFLTLDIASGVESLDDNFIGLFGTIGNDIIDVTGISSYVSGASWSLGTIS